MRTFVHMTLCACVYKTCAACLGDCVRACARRQLLCLNAASERVGDAAAWLEDVPSSLLHYAGQIKHWSKDQIVGCSCVDEITLDAPEARWKSLVLTDSFLTSVCVRF